MTADQYVEAIQARSPAWFDLARGAARYRRGRTPSHLGWTALNALQYSGSYAKETGVHGVSGVDVLAISTTTVSTCESAIPGRRPTYRCTSMPCDVERRMALISDGAIMPGINVTKLENLKIVVPPVPWQRDFTDRCSRSPV